MSHFKAPDNPQPPQAEKHPYRQQHHGFVTTDNYHWLRADNWQEAMREPDKLPAAIKNYLQAENDYFKACMKETETLQKQLIAEMRARIKEDDTSVPEKHGNYAYQTRYTEGTEYPVYIRTDRDGADEEILLDINKEAQHEDYFDLGSVTVSPQHGKLAWSADTNGAEYFTLKIRDINTGEDLPYVINDVDSVAWINESSLLYTKVDKHHRANKVYRHQLASDGEDELILEEKDSRFDMAVSRLLSGDYIAIQIRMNDQNETWVLPTQQPDAKPQLIQARQEGLEYDIEQQGEQFIILTNADDAEDFKIVTTPVATPQKANWKDIVPHQQGRMIIDLEVYQDWLIWMERENALPAIKIRHITDQPGNEKSIQFTEEAYALGIHPSREYTSNNLRFSYSSPTTPSQIYDYDLQSDQHKLRKQTEIPSGHNPQDYITRRLTALSHDGAEVPITVLHHQSTPLDGSAPCLLYGYGSYGSSIPAAFSSNRLSLVDRGFIYAIAHVRGGQEKGRAWYEAAKKAGKPNTFHDFIAVAEHLIQHHYTQQANIVCHGASAGGLLIGAVVNMRPDLFAAAIADVPFVDMLNTILDDSLPLTPGEWSQWGNPIESKQAYQWIASYSPYDNVSAQAYPAMLITAGVSDPRVTYWEPAKWVAKLRELKTDDKILLLKTNMSSGHFGTSGRFAILEDLAEAYAFALKATGSWEPV